MTTIEIQNIPKRLVFFYYWNCMLKIWFKKAKKIQTISQVIIFPEIFGLESNLMNSKIREEKKQIQFC